MKFSSPNDVVGGYILTVLTPVFLILAPPFFHCVTGDQVSFLTIQAVKSEWSNLDKSNFHIPGLVVRVLLKNVSV